MKRSILGNARQLGRDPYSWTVVRFDVETRSKAKLKKVGPWVYARDPSTELLVLKFAVGNGPMQTFIPDMFNLCRCPQEWARLVSSPSVVFEAFNAFFEWSIYHFVLVERYGWPPIPVERWRCAMATSCYYALPRALDTCAQALGLLEQKDKEGHRVMLKLSQPRKPTKNNPATYHSKSEDFEKLFSYCGQDVEVHRAIADQIGELPPDELLIWQVDQLINRRGVYCDVEAVRGAIAILDQVMGWYQERIRELTNGEVETTNQTAKIVQWCAERGVQLENLQAKTVEDTLDQGVMHWGDDGEYHIVELPREVREVLTIRRSAAKSSVKKFQSMLDRVDLRDNRIRSTLVYHGASTGRWSGSGIQPQNFPRGNFKFYHPKKAPNAPRVEDVVALVTARDIDGLRELGDVPEILSSVLRSMLCSPAGKKLVAADYSAIEARVLFWLVGEERGLEIFRTTGLVYEDMAATIYSVHMDTVTENQRWLGKQAVLGLGYQMAAAKFQKQCTGYGVMIDPALAELVVQTYRSQYKRVVEYWKKVNSAAMFAVRTGEVTACGRVTFFMQGEFLRCRLPSGRCISYHRPHFVPSRFNPDELSLAYWGMDSQSHKWKVLHTYGGKLTENIVQAISGCILREASINLETGGYPIVLTVHDELVCEVPDNPRYNVEMMTHLMCSIGAWAQGIPLKAEGWEGYRFKK